jgi:large subunit ribosomal protein L21
MYAIVEIAGQQFKVAKDQKVYVHRLQDKEGSKVTFDNVLLLDDGKVTLGAPAIKGAAVTAKILKHLKGDKVIVFKKKRRKGYKVKNGHRQYLSEIQIESIVASGAKTAPAKKVEAPSPAKKVAAPVKAAAPKKEAVKVEKTAPAPKKEAKTVDLSKNTVAELKEMAKAKGIEGISSMKKADLIAALTK